MTSNVQPATTEAVGSSLFPRSVSVLATPPATPLGPTVAERVAAVPGLSSSELRAADPSAMAATLQDLWSAMTNRPVEELENEEKCPDGTPRLSSTIAVWMIGKITEAYGSPLVKLSTVKDADALRSFGGVSRLLVGAIHAQANSTAA